MVHDGEAGPMKVEEKQRMERMERMIIKCKVKMV